MEAEEARKKIEELGTEFSTDSFFVSIKNGDYTIVELLLDGGVSPDTRDRQGNAAVVVARESSQIEIGRLLLVRGARPEPLLRSNSKQKDLWDKITASSSILSFISSLLIAAVGGYFTYSYNQRQIDLNRTQAEHDSATKEQGNKVLELEAVQKIIPTLTSNDEKQKAAALTAIQDLAHPILAADLAALFKGQGSIQYLQQAVSSGDSGAKQAAVKALSTIVASGSSPDSQQAIGALAGSVEAIAGTTLRQIGEDPNTPPAERDLANSGQSGVDAAQYVFPVISKCGRNAITQATGFRLKGMTGIVSALHAVLGCKDIQVLAGNVLYRGTYHP